MDIRYIVCVPLYLSLGVLPLFMPHASVQAAPLASTLATGLDNLLADTARAIARTDQAGCLWRDTESIYSRAQRAARQHDPAKARALAQRAGQQARLALSQCRLEHARYQLGRMHPAQMDAAHRTRYRRLRDAIRQRDAETAISLLKALEKGVKP